MESKPEKQHEWLQQLVGEWTFEGECMTGPGQPPMKNTGTLSSRMLGGLWFVGDMTSDMPGDAEPAKSILTIGYDPQRQRFTGTFVASMMSHLWIYDGSLDAGGKVLTLDAEGPSFMGDGSMAKYQDIYTVHGPDHHELSSQALDPDGKWQRFMTAHYHRKK